MNKEYIDVFLHSEAETKKYLGPWHGVGDILGIHFEHAFDILLEEFENENSDIRKDIKYYALRCWPQCAEHIARVGIAWEDGSAEDGYFGYWYVSSFEILAIPQLEEEKDG